MRQKEGASVGEEETENKEEFRVWQQMGRRGLVQMQGEKRLEDQKRTQVWYSGLANGCNSEFLHCLP